jgi:hypothetical protein
VNPEVRKGDEVRVTLRVGEHRWDRRLCRVQRVFKVYGKWVADCVPLDAGGDAIPVAVPVNPLSVQPFADEVNPAFQALVDVFMGPSAEVDR